MLAVMLHRAVDVDADAAEFWRTDLESRRAGHRRLVGALRSAGALATGVRPPRLIDTLTTLLGPDVYTTLVIERAWSSAEWERWAGRELSQEFFG